MPTYEGEPGPTLEFLKSMAKGDQANVSVLSLGSHTGTHIDAPSHFVHGGASLDGLALDTFVGPARVVEYKGEGHITAAELTALDVPTDCERILFKTKNGSLWDDLEFRRDFSAVAPDAARELASRRLKLVGIDYLSIEPFGAEMPDTHTTLLSSGCVVLEGLDLRDIQPGTYFLVCAPLNVVGAEGAPARAILIEDLT
jgi:arylformamidase